MPMFRAKFLKQTSDINDKSLCGETALTAGSVDSQQQTDIDSETLQSGLSGIVGEFQT